MPNTLSRARLTPFGVALLAACVVLPCAAKAQQQDSQTQQDQSVADAARRNREQKKNAKRQSRVISNEDLDTEYFKPGQEGLNLDAPSKTKTEVTSASAAATDDGDQAVSSAKKESRSKGEDSEEAAAEDAQIAKLQKQIAESEEALKWQKRELALDQDTVYSNPNYTDSKTGKDKLDAKQQQINERQQEIEGLEAQLAALQERRAQTAPAESSPPGR